jgi:hypothetical protein
MQSYRSWKLLLFWSLLACGSTSWWLLKVDAVRATTLTQWKHKTLMLPKIPPFDKNRVDSQPFAKTENRLEGFPSLKNLEAREDIFSFTPFLGVKTSASAVAFPIKVMLKDVEKPCQTINCGSVAMVQSNRLTKMFPRNRYALTQSARRVLVQSTSFTAIASTSSFNDLFNDSFNPSFDTQHPISKKIKRTKPTKIIITQIPPSPAAPENPQKPNEPPQIEAQPNEPTPIDPKQIEQRLEIPKVDYSKRLERLLQKLAETKSQLPESTINRELGTIIAKPQAEVNRELGRIIAKPATDGKPIEQLPFPETPSKTPPVSKKQPLVTKPIGFLLGRVSYFQTNNLFSSDIDPIQDGLIYSGLSLASAPLKLGTKTYLSGSIDGNIISYIDQSEFNYNQLRFNVDLYRQLSKRMYGEIGWSNQQLFYARDSKRYGFASGDRFLNENSFHLSFARRDPLSSKLMLDSYYEFRVSLGETPEKRNRVINSLSLGLNYYLQKPLQVGLNYQANLSNFTERDREDFYHRLFSSLNYKLSDTSSLSAQAGISIGNSTESSINFSGWFFNVNYNWELGRF